MYEHRHQREFGQIVGLAWRLVRSEQGGWAVLFYYALMHLAGIANRAGLRRLADRLRRFIRISRVEAGCSSLLRAKYRFVVTDVGGCAVDIDNEHDYDVVSQRYDTWRKAQRERAERLYGPLPLPASASPVEREK
jgi:hypothetical protein